MLVTVCPGVEFTSLFPCTLNDTAQATVSPAHDALELTVLDVIPAQMQAVTLQLIFQNPMLGDDLLMRVLGNPLKRGMWLGNKSAHADIHVGLAAQQFLTFAQNGFAQIDNGLDIFEGFFGV